jgi:hypothetical protein
LIGRGVTSTSATCVPVGSADVPERVPRDDPPNSAIAGELRRARCVAAEAETRATELIAASLRRGIPEADGFGSAAAWVISVTEDPPAVCRAQVRVGPGFAAYAPGPAGVHPGGVVRAQGAAAGRRQWGLDRCCEGLRAAPPRRVVHVGGHGAGRRRPGSCIRQGGAGRHRVAGRTLGARSGRHQEPAAAAGRCPGRDLPPPRQRPHCSPRCPGPRPSAGGGGPSRPHRAQRAAASARPAGWGLPPSGL